MPKLARTVLALTTVLAGAVTASPAHAREDTGGRAEHCLATVETGRSVCFASEGDVAAWKAANPGWRVLVLFFDGADFRGAKKELGGFRNCSATKGDVDYGNPSMPYGWDNRVGSFITMNGCDVMGYRHRDYGGGHFTAYTDQAAKLGSWDNDLSSFRLS